MASGRLDEIASVNLPGSQELEFITIWGICMSNKVKVISLLVAGLASSAAFGQSNVTIYGIVDAGYAYRWDAENRTTGAHSRSSIDTGQAGANRLGFKGMEDLGDGLKAVFLLEQGFSFDNGTMGQGGKMFGRQAYVGLTGGFGSVIAGRTYAPHFSLVASTDPFAAGTVGNYRNVWGNTGPFNGGGGSLRNLIDPTRFDNAVTYTTPKFGGFDATLVYGNAVADNDVAGGTEDTGDNAKNNTVYGALFKYADGPVVAGFNMHRIALRSGISDATLKTVDNFAIAGKFDAKVVRLAAVASYTVWDASSSQGDATTSNYLLGATIPLGKFDLKASINYSDFNGKQNNAQNLHGQATQYAIGANYKLSARTDLYTAYALIDGQASRSSSYTMADAGPNNGNAAANNPYQQGFQIGVRHLF